tara:strand:- start:494 stop:1513 length:1020 start_codon:yes stop_codon:yes gene_type:complete
MGPEVFDLENKLADYVGVDYCIACASGTDALLIPLMAKGIGPGDAVITTPFTYIATAEVIALLGAEPVFADIYPNTFNIDPYEIKKAIKRATEKGLRPRAIIPVDLFGLPSRYRMINEIAKEENLFILEDAAQGLGGAIRSKKAGSFGDVASTSFFPAKPLGCYGDGGAIFTDNKSLADKMKSIRVHGSGLDKYENTRIGINGRLDTIQAAVLLEKLSIFNSELKNRNKIAKYYTKKISPQFQKPYIPNEYFSSWAQYSILAQDEDHKNKIMLSLKNSDIPVMVYYKIPLHLQKCFDKLNYKPGDFPVAEDCSKRIFSLPMHPYLSKEDQDKIVGIINE